MTKLVQNDIASLTNEQSALAALNSNYSLLETFSDSVLSRDGTTPNQMQADLDMNSNDILNLPAPVQANSPLRLAELSALQAAAGGTVNIGTSTGSITHNVNLTGSVDESLRTKLTTELYSVKDFGATGNGTTDDTTFINAAIAAMPSSGGSLYFPAGTYKVSSAITLSKPGVYYGDGLATKIVTNSATATIFLMSGSLMWLRDMMFDSSVTRTGGQYIDITGFQNYIENFYMLHGWNGFRCSGTSNQTTIQHGYMRDFVAANGTLLLISQNAGSDGLVTFRDIVSDHAANIFSGVQILCAGEVTIEDCDLIHCGEVIYINPAVGQTIASIYVNNCFFDTSSRGLYILGNGGNLVRAIFDQCWFSSHNNEGIRIENTGGGTIDGIDFVNCAAHLNGFTGLQIVSSSVKNVRWLGGEMAQNGSDGVRIAANTNEFAFIGARIGGSFGLANNGGFGINIIAGTSDNYTISNCDLRNNTSGALSDNGTGGNKFIQHVSGPLSTSRGTTASGTQVLNSIAATKTATTGGGGIPQMLNLSYTDNSTSVTAENSTQILRFGYTWNGTTPSSAFDTLFDLNSAVQQNLGTLNGIEIEGPVVSNTKTLTQWRGIDITAPSGAGTVTSKSSINVQAGGGNITTADGVLSSGTAGLGYSTGAGGTVTQGAGAKTNGVTLNKITGAITMDASALAASTTVSFTLTNSTIAATDTIILNHVSGGTAGSYTLNAQPAGGTASINVRNVSLGSLSEAIVIRFTVIKSVSA